MIINGRFGKALRVAEELQAWINDTLGDRFALEHPYVAVTYTEVSLDLSLGEIGLWCDQADSEDDLTVEYCKGVLRKYAEPFAMLNDG